MLVGRTCPSVVAPMDVMQGNWIFIAGSHIMMIVAPAICVAGVLFAVVVAWIHSKKWKWSWPSWSSKSNPAPSKSNPTPPKPTPPNPTPVPPKPTPVPPKPVPVPPKPTPVPPKPTPVPPKPTPVPPKPVPVPKPTPVPPKPITPPVATSTRVLDRLPWPAAATDGRSLRLRAILQALKNTHKKSTDPSEDWAPYVYRREAGGDGLTYVLRTSGDLVAKVESFAETWRRGTVLVANMPRLAGMGKVKPYQLDNLRAFVDGAKAWGVCPNVEADRALGSPAAAFAQMQNVPDTTKPNRPMLGYHLTFATCPLPEDAHPSKTPIMDNRFDSFVHEMSHVGCSSGPGCAERSGHGISQACLATSLHRMSHTLGLRAHNYRWKCKADCGNCGTPERPGDPCGPWPETLFRVG